MPAVTKVSISLPTELYQQAATHARAQHRTFSAQVAYALEQDLGSVIPPINHAALVAAVEHAADEHARSRGKARRTQPRS